MELLIVLIILLSVRANSSECEWEGGGNKKLICKVGSLNYKPQALPQVDAAESLVVECSGVEQGPGIRPNQFRSLPNLRQITLRSCLTQVLPPGEFSGLTNLEELSIQQDPEIQPILHPDTLTQLPNLRALDMSMTALTSLPVDMLCGVKNLRSLNISRNTLENIKDLGLESCQLLHLEQLDLSFNALKSLSAGDLNSVPSLQKLYLNNNQISSLSDESLAGFWSLELLDLSYNLISHLQSDIFKDTSQLNKLFLQHNRIQRIQDKTFTGLNNLLLLNLSHNALTSDSLNNQTFQEQGKLVALDLSYNEISRIEAGNLLNLPGLQILNLQHNLIQDIQSQSFQSLRNLHILMLSENQLSTLPSSLFSPLSSLNSLSLDHNLLASLPEDLFSASSNLGVLALNSNLLEAIPSALGSLINLRTLDLGENMIKQVENSELAGLVNLYGLRLAGNRLSAVQAGLFTNNSNLNVLNLANNKIKEIKQDSLKNLRNLKGLRLDANELTELNGLVSSLKNLKWLNVSTNNIHWFDFAFIPKSLEWLDVHNNKIDKIGNYYQLSSEFSLVTLDASFNQISKLEENSLLLGLKHIYLTHNRIETVASGVFRDLANLTRVELQHNQLKSIQLDALATSTSGGPPEVLMSENPWLCDCELEWLKNINRLSVNSNYARVQDIESMTCITSSPALVSSPVPILLVESKEFLCEYEAHCVANCFCCDFFACDCRMQCPEGCTCFHDNQWTSNIIQCSHGDFSDVPPLIPMDATSVYLDGNNMTELESPGFIGRRRIEEVYLNNSQIQTITNYSFEGLTGVKMLHLEFNLLSSLMGNEFNGLVELKELFLQNNRLVAIGAETFSTLSSLTTLRLDGNQLTSFPVWELSVNPILSSLFLGGNLWSCDCEFLNPFLVFQWKFGSKLQEKEDLRCVKDPVQNPVTSALISSVVCGDDMKTNVQSSITSVDYTPILVAVFLAVLLIVIAYLVIFTFRRRIKLWFHSKNEDKSVYAPTNDKLFDVFISYSMEDKQFVENSFAANLEHGATSYRLCLHQRDFNPSTPIYDSVSVATESSSKTILMLSRSYLRSQWPLIRTTFISTLMNNSSKVIFIQLEELLEEELDEWTDLKQLMGSSPVIKWGESGFWSKLRYYLPEPVYLTFHRNVTLRGGTLNSRSHYEPVAPNQIWTYFVEDSHSSLDTNTTEMSDTSNESSKSPNLDHTYYSIDANHIYHTLDPGAPCAHNPPRGRIYINRNLDLIDNKGAVCLVQGGGEQGSVRLVQSGDQGGARPSQRFSITPPPSFSVNHKKPMHCTDSEYVV